MWDSEQSESGKQKDWLVSGEGYGDGGGIGLPTDSRPVELSENHKRG
jgi:hypothetical protein